MIWQMLMKMKDDVNGWCYHVDGNACHIEIDKRQKGDDFITCVLHELVHVKQFLKRELVDTNGLESKWKGEAYLYIDYYNLPWEKEAYHLQEVLLKEYKNECHNA